VTLPPTTNREELILVLAPTGRDASLTAAMLTKVGVCSLVCPNLDVLCDEIRKGAGGAALAQEALTIDYVDRLADQLRQEPSWSDFPILILTGRGLESKEHLLTDGLLGQLGNVTLLERPMRLQTMLSAVRSALRSRRRQYQTRDLIVQREKSIARLELVAEVSNRLLTSDRPEAMLESLFQKLSQQLGLEIYLAYLHDESTKQLHLSAHSGIPSRVAQNIECLSFDQLGLGPNDTLQPAMQERFCLAGPNSDWLRSMGVTAYATYPLCARDQIIGSLSFGTRKKPHFNADELAIMATVCNQVAVAMEKRRAEDQLKNFNQVLEQRVRERTAALKEVNEQMEAFIYSVSHDLRAPLRAMISFSEILLGSYSDVLDEEGREYLSRIAKSSRYMDSLTNDLLHYSRLSRWEFSLSDVDLEACVATVLYNFHSEIEKTKACIKIDYPLPPVLAHCSPLEQIIANLLSNALKFAKKDQVPTIHLYTEDRAEFLRIWVEDKGIGIEPQYYERIFRMFERLHGTNAYPGTGMGLAIVKKAIERMGGRVGIDSKPDEGCRFWFELRKAPKVEATLLDDKKQLATAEL
jgi:signal transduction histidine kinase